MFDAYPFILPMLIIWVPLFALTVAIFHTRWGVSSRPVLNRVAYKKILSIILLCVALTIMASGIVQLAGSFFIVAGKPLKYWHALAGFTFVLIALLHLTVHVRDLWFYVFPRKQKPADPPQT